jgi:hypothetical protein
VRTPANWPVGTAEDTGIAASREDDPFLKKSFSDKPRTRLYAILRLETQRFAKSGMMKKFL